MVFKGLILVTHELCAAKSPAQAFLVPVLTPLLFRIHPFLKGCIGAEASCEQLVTLRQRVARIRVEGAGQCGRNNVLHLALRQPVSDAIAQEAKRRTIFFGHDVLIERTDQHEHVVVA